MNTERFSQLIEAYGAEPARWPVAERAAAGRFAAEHPQLEFKLEAERRLDRQLDGYRVSAPSADLQRRIVTRLLAQRRLSRPIRAAIAALCALGTTVALGAGAELGATAMAAVASPAPPAAGRLYEDSSFGDVLPAGPAASSSET